MTVNEDDQGIRRRRYYIDPEASSHDLLNDATEWLQYARGLTDLLAEFVHEGDGVDCRRTALSLEAVAALTHMGVQCVAEAHARMTWERAKALAQEKRGVAP
jgi:hypothetical protein